MYRQEQSPGVPKDIFILILGASISFLTTMLTLHYTNDENNKREDYRVLREDYQKKNAFIEEIANNSGKRVFLTTKLFKSVQDQDQPKIKLYSDKYDSILEVWNSRYLSYFGLMKIYFNNSWRTRFNSTVYAPFVKYSGILKDKMKDKKFDIKKNSDLEAKLNKLRDDMDDFFEDLYNYNECTYMAKTKN